MSNEQRNERNANTTNPNTTGAQGMASEPVISVRDLTVSFASEAGTVHAVRGMNFDLYPGKTLGIVGESGSGKSVTSMAIMGLLDKNASVKGSITYHGEELLNKSDFEMSEIRGKGIAMVFQDPLSALTPVFSIGDQIKEALVTHNPKMTEQQIHDRSIELMNLVGIPDPEGRLKSFPHEFSGGMRQRVMIAMAIANDPDVIIADEPTTALDVTIQAQVLEVLRKAQRETGAAVIFITHDLGVIAGVADDIVVMYAGRPVEKADVDSIFDHPAMPYTMGLLGAVPRSDRERNSRLVPIPGSPMNLVNMPKGCPFAPRCPLATDICHTTEPAMEPVPGRPGQFVACHRTQEIVSKGLTFHDVYTVAEAAKSKFAGIPRDERKMVLDVKHMRKTFPLTAGGFLRRKIGEVKAVDDVTLDVREGETVALVGESGSGKSTTLMEIMAFKQPQDGEIEMFGTKLEHKMPREKRRELRSAVQYVFQDPMSSLDPRLPIYDILAEPMKVQHYSKEQIRERIGELMRLVELNPDQVDRFPTQFSGGQRQRIAIARALSVNPKLVLLDEPVSALDVSIQAGVINLLEDLQNKLGVAYLFVAHNLSVVRHISSRVAVMYLGRIVESGDTEDVFEHPLHPYTQALISAVPVPDPKAERTRQRIVLEGEVPSPTETFEGCPFMGRCPLMPKLSAEQQARCRGERPALRPYDTSRPSGHQVACHFA
ncbi:ABC transporter ATP-binding protein [Bifidobacterium breve]|jgi:oligopeptide/dipeptide ABC transporter ATP-binding protein|uniref:ABC transporter ATP-binding protein n=1 Tax=Bifidobacterium breve TaxID=1685 RepID=A0AAW4U3C7_BIFBR|nr:ABC transporter ATP-binding protein [Bifidobacterium breve]MCB8547612.1 ABC transporter ATP-binding protein [Bifidobacterium sp. MSK23_125]MCB8554434.1 ABC transporter ATP-binding protein [Bifidobacterium sp. MSK23_139]MBU9890677.1 ABC transporter ATP-binding protein [Bifidobacterium breve]MBV3240245.1 ABC transporter ATP-binding protein [Bifidobacterium breve]MBV3254138.1 ABC transporter ATP-binding protein [Bifidobacterium breve]